VKVTVSAEDWMHIWNWLAPSQKHGKNELCVGPLTVVADNVSLRKIENDRWRMRIHGWPLSPEGKRRLLAALDVEDMKIG